MTGFLPRPSPATIDVALAGGGIMKLPLCKVCQKPEISARDEAKLRREKVQLGRCRCTKRQKGHNLERNER